MVTLKNLKKHASKVLAVVLTAGVLFGLGYNSFASKTEQTPTVKPAGEKWFHLKDGGDQMDPSDYELANGTGENKEDCNPGTVEICSIFAQPNASNPSQPDLSTVDPTQTTRRSATN